MCITLRFLEIYFLLLLLFLVLKSEQFWNNNRKTSIARYSKNVIFIHLFTRIVLFIISLTMHIICRGICTYMQNMQIHAEEYAHICRGICTYLQNMQMYAQEYADICTGVYTYVFIFTKCLMNQFFYVQGVHKVSLQFKKIYYKGKWWDFLIKFVLCTQ